MVKLLAGGNPQIPKGDGDEPVQQYISAMPGWKQDLGRRLDALITKAIPGVKKAVRWNSPFYGIEGQGWIVSFHCFTKFVKVTFFAGADMVDGPTGGSGSVGRWVNIHEGELDEGQLKAWLKQAMELPGWGKI